VERHFWFAYRIPSRLRREFLRFETYMKRNTNYLAPVDTHRRQATLEGRRKGL